MHVSCVKFILLVFCAVIRHGFSQTTEDRPVFDINVSELCTPPEICVPHYQCLPNNSLNIFGARNINPRIFARFSDDLNPNFTTVRLKDGATAQMCKQLELCCGGNAIIESPQPEVTNVTKDCGIRNPNGILFHVKTNDTGLSQFGEFPWTMALIRKNPSSSQYKLMCGGSLIHPSVVLTAAHCVYSLRNKRNTFIVRAGEWDTQIDIENIPHQERTVTEIIIHENFQSATLLHDIALLILVKPFELRDSIQTICLPARDFSSDGEQACYASGWGTQNFQNPSLRTAIMKKVQLPVVSRIVCQRNLRTLRELGSLFQLHNSFMCAGGVRDQDTCFGDGGSPLVCPYRDQPNRYYQSGIVAGGVGCGMENIPALYADVAKHRDWIDRKMSLRNYSL